MARLLARSLLDVYSKREGEQWDEFQRREEEFYEKHDQETRTLPEDEVVGAMLQFREADGYAVYLVVRDKPLTLQHVANGYGCDPIFIRGLRRKDILEHLAREKRLRELFA